jgi:peptidoglycan-associated lipoprotein
VAVGFTSNGQQLVDKSVAAAVSTETMEQSANHFDHLSTVYFIESSDREAPPAQGVSLNISVPEKSVFNFATNKYDVNAADFEYLEQHADFLRRNPSLTLTISGHTDVQGSVKYNQQLSLKRAVRVYNLLVAYGAPASQIIVDNYGATFPLYSDSNWNQNRRVELQYSKQMSLSAS